MAPHTKLPNNSITANKSPETERGYNPTSRLGYNFSYSTLSVGIVCATSRSVWPVRPHTVGTVFTATRIQAKPAAARSSHALACKRVHELRVFACLAPLLFVHKPGRRNRNGHAKSPAGAVARAGGGGHVAVIVSLVFPRNMCYYLYRNKTRGAQHENHN